MPTPCPSCNKFASYEVSEPEVNTLELDNDSVNYEVQVVRTSACCGDEMNEYTFSGDEDLDNDLRDKLEALRDENPDVEVEVEEGSVESLEESGGRYKKSYFGFHLTVNFVTYTPGPGLTDDEKAELEAFTAKTNGTPLTDEEKKRKSVLMFKTYPTLGANLDTTPAVGLTDDEAAEYKMLEEKPTMKMLNEVDSARRRELFLKTKPIGTTLGSMEISDKAAASDFESLV